MGEAFWGLLLQALSTLVKVEGGSLVEPVSCYGLVWIGAPSSSRVIAPAPRTDMSARTLVLTRGCSAVHSAAVHPGSEEWGGKATCADRQATLQSPGLLGKGSTLFVLQSGWPSVTWWEKFFPDTHSMSSYHSATAFWMSTLISAPLSICAYFAAFSFKCGGGRKGS